MAKKPERKQKLKVYRTPIGFHDAYVAAASQKAALEAWGADSNLFAQGIAEQVTEPELMAEALANPGMIVKRVRGSTDDHFAELERSKPRKTRKGDETAAAKPKSRPKSKPSRKELDAAEEALERAERKQRKEVGEIDDRIRRLERKRRELQRELEEERDILSRKRDDAWSAYERAMREWRE